MTVGELRKALEGVADHYRLLMDAGCGPGALEADIAHLYTIPERHVAPEFTAKFGVSSTPAETVFLIE